jgi:Amino acid permease
MTVTAAVLAEICSALPVSGSIYIWAAESAGPKYARFFGFIVAWWSCTAWMTFTAGNCQVRNTLLPACYLLNLFHRQLPTIWSHSLRSGKSIFQVVLAIRTLDGELLFGLYRRGFCSLLLRSIICRRDCTRRSSSSRLQLSCLTSSFA